MPAGRTALHGRITKDDIRSAGLRRWDGRKRITTDWVNLYHEPELCFPTGDCFVFLREPGQSSRGPSFRVNISKLRVRGFGALADRCTQQVQFTHEKPECLTNGCKGCGKPSIMRALYLPAPRGADFDTIIDHHLGIRNFFAWLYNMPLAGRTLGKSFAELKDHLDLYRPDQEAQNEADIVSFADFQRYLDFRECVDHALATMQFAEKCQIEDLWIDAFAHCVGMAHKGLLTSLEYPNISRTSKTLIRKARQEVDIRSDRVSRSVANFFENDLSAAFLGLHQAAREHLDRFRSFLLSFYIERHGYWPPQDFDDEEVKKARYIELYSDFRNLYSHLVDPVSTTSMVDNVSHSGGVCTLQNVQAFDNRHSYEGLPHPLPRIPEPPTLTTSKSSSSRLGSLNLGKKRREQRELRDEQSMQALIDSSNRDWNIMACLLVRRYSEFERLSILDDFENVSLVDGRKVRWILIYAVLQTLITVMQAPRQVRNTEGLSYTLCCHIPKVMPWARSRAGSFDTNSLASSRTSEATGSTKVELTPDVNYSHTNAPSIVSSQVPSRSRNERRNSLPTTTTTRSTSSVSRKPSTASRSSSLRRLLVRRPTAEDNPVPTLPASLKRSNTSTPSFCEIFVQGYGNGLNDAIVSSPTSASPDTLTPKAISPPVPVADVRVSRESSSASASSAYTARSAGSSSNDSGGAAAPDMDHMSVSGEDGDGSDGHRRRRSSASNAGTAKGKGKGRAEANKAVVGGSVRRARMSVGGSNEALLDYDGKRFRPGGALRDDREEEDFVDEEVALREVHFNTDTWDRFLDG